MNSTFLSNPQVAQLAWTVFWQSSLFILGIAVLDVILKPWVSARSRYLLSLLVWVRLLVPPGFTVPINFWPEGAALLVQAVDAIPIAGQAGSAQMDASQGFLASSVPGYLIFWAVSSLALVALIVFRLAAASRTIRNARKVAEYEGLAVWEHGDCTSPMLVGLVRPAVLLPPHFATSVSPSHLEGVLRHEWFHHKRRDQWVALVQSLLVCAFWWNPLIWWWNHRTNRLRERAVDESVLEQHPEYLAALVGTARWVRKTLPAPLLGVLNNRSDLASRIVHLTAVPKWRIPSWVMAPALTCLIGITVCVGRAQPLTSAGRYVEVLFNVTYHRMAKDKVSRFDLDLSKMATPIPASRIKRIRDSMRSSESLPTLDFSKFRDGNFSWIVAPRKENQVNYRVGEMGNVVGAEVLLGAKGGTWPQSELAIIPSKDDYFQIAWKANATTPLYSARHQLKRGDGLVLLRPDPTDPKKVEAIFVRAEKSFVNPDDGSDSSDFGARILPD